MAGTTAAKKTTTRKAPARKAAPGKAVPDATLEVKVKAPPGVFDLDNLTKAQALPDLDLPTTPFEFLLAGRTYQLSDPRDNDWKDSWQLAANPFLLMRACLVGADDPVDDPTEEEITNARIRLNLGKEEEQDSEATEDDGEEPKVQVILLDRFTAAPLPGWKLNALLDNWHAHYKIDLSHGRGILDVLLGRADAAE